MRSSLLTLLILLGISNLAFTQNMSYDQLSTASIWNRYTTYTSKDGTVYKIGDKIRIGVPSSGKDFTFITQGDGITSDITALPASFSGIETEIKRMDILGSKRAGFQISFRTKGLTGLVNYSIQFENALETGEVKSSGISSDDALIELKKAKDKLDLELITQAEYDSIKVVYKKYIK